MRICSIIASNYASFARVLAESFLTHHPGGRCSVLVIDHPERLDPDAEPFDVLSPRELEIEDFDCMAGSYDVLELSTAVKPWLLRHLLRDEEAVVYLDPDIRIFGDISEVGELARAHGLVLTPHAAEAMPRDGRRPTEADILMAGAYNLGFLGLGATDATDAFLEWWMERLRTDCRVDPANGFFVDQRWMDLAPGIVPDVKLLRDPGYNVAYWNLAGRRLTEAGGRIEVNGSPLRFFHFSGFDPHAPHRLSKHQDRVIVREDPVLASLCADYAGELLGHGFDDHRGIPYGFDTLPDGERLTRVMRRLYARGHSEGVLGKSLFSEAGLTEFYAWIGETTGAGEFPLSRYLLAAWQERPDLQAAFPAPEAGSARDYVRWLWEEGRDQLSIPAHLMPPAPDEVSAVASEPREDGALPTWGVNVVGHLRSELGIGEAARAAISALDSQRIPVLPLQVPRLPLSRQGHGYAACDPAIGTFPVNLLCVNADMLPDLADRAGPELFAGRYSIGLWFWEVNVFPEQWLGSFDLVDEVWVASRHAADAIAPVSPVPVQTVRLPVAVPPVVPPPRASLGLPEGFLFLFLFDFHSVLERKNPLGLIEAFDRAFTPSDGAQLVIKTINGGHHPAKLQLLRAAAAGRPDVHVIDGYVSPTEKNALHASADCYASLHRSEGLGITVAEAMCLGKPVIATGYSGTLEFTTDRNSYLVDYAEVPVGKGRSPYPAHATWAEPDLDHAASLMRRVFEDREGALATGRRAAADMAEHHSPEAAGRLLRRRLETLVTARGISHGTAAAPGVSLGHLRAPGTQPYGRSRPTPLRRAARAAVMRAVKPYAVANDALTGALAEAIEQVSAAAAAGRVAEAHALAEALAELRRLRADSDRASAELRSALHAALERLDAHDADGRRLESSQAPIEEVRADLAALGREIEPAKRLVAETQAIPYMSSRAFSSFDDERFGRVLGYGAAEESRGAENGHPSPYIRFEELFRGSESFVRERQRVYLGLAAEHSPVVDIGCGRGEFLDLLRERGVEYTGVDADAEMVRHCAAKGHTSVKERDGIDYLESLPDASLGLVFSAQVIEHMTPEKISRFFELAHAKLRPGGVLVAETVNPHSAQALKTFWVDLTHQHPVFPEVALALCGIAGFPQAFVFHPNGTGEFEADRVNEGEYAVVAERGGAAPSVTGSASARASLVR